MADADWVTLTIIAQIWYLELSIQEKLHHQHIRYLHNPNFINKKCLHYRRRQYDDRNNARIAYNDKLKEVSAWLVGMERDFSRVRPVAKDLGTIKDQYEELKVSLSWNILTDPIYIR